MHETETKKEWSSEELQRRQRLRRESMFQSRRYTLNVPEDWAEIFGNAATSDSNIYIPRSKKDRQSVWIYANPSKTQPSRKPVTHTEEVAVYKKVIPELHPSFRRRTGSSEDKSTSEKDSREKAKHVTYGAVEQIQ